MTQASRLEKTAVSPKAWTMLGIGVAAQAAGTVFVSTPAFLIPLLHSEHGLSLTQAGTLAAAPTFGMVLTLVAWGAMADRFGEKWVISIGLGLTAIAALAATTTDNYALLGIAFLLGGMAAASTNAASGRVVVGWFPKDRRGLAMGIRQMSQPLGVTHRVADHPDSRCERRNRFGRRTVRSSQRRSRPDLRRRIDQSPAAGSTAHR